MPRILPALCLLTLFASAAHAADPAAAARPVEQVRAIEQRVAERLAASDSTHSHVANAGHVKTATTSESKSPTKTNVRAADPVASSPRTAPAATHAAAHTDALDAEAIWSVLLAGNRRFVDGKPDPRPYAAQRAALARSQSPRTIVLACADSRVSPELLFDQSLGDLFVVRTAGNVADAVGLGSIEYAVVHLHAPLIVVVGHERCGAVSAALQPGDMPTPNLQAIVDRIRPATLKPRTCFEGEELLSRSVLSNVHQSARDLAANSSIIRDHISEKKLTIKRAVYDLATGVIRTTE